MNPGWVRTLTLWRAMRVGFSALLLLELGIAVVAGIAARTGPAAAHPAPYANGLMMQLMLGSFVPLFAGAAAGAFLPLMPGPRWLKAANRRWLWQFLLGGAALQWLLVGLPPMLLSWPHAPLTTLVVSVATVGGSWVLGLAALVLLPAKWRGAVVLPLTATGLVVPAMQHQLAGMAPAAAQAWALGIGSIACVLAGHGLRRVVQRLCDPDAPAVPLPTLGTGGLLNPAGPNTTRTTAPSGRSLAELVMPLAPSSRRTAIPLLGLALLWLWAGSQVQVSVEQALQQCLVALWCIDSLGSFESVWLSSRAVLLPRGLRRSGLANVVIRCALRNHLRRGGLIALGMGILAPLGYGVALSDALAVGLIGGFVSLLGLAMNLVLGAREESSGLRLTARFALGLAYSAAVLALGFAGLGWSATPGFAMWRWVMLAAGTSVPVLALACLFSARRWPRLDWGQMPSQPAWASRLR